MGWQIFLLAFIVLYLVAAVVAMKGYKYLTSQHTRPGVSADVSIDVSPDGKLMVFNAMGSGGSDLFLLDLATKRVVGVADTPEYETGPSFSPDGKSIIYSAGRVGDRADHIFSRSAAGGPPRQITFGNANDRSPRFSPDGKLIVFTRDTDYRWGGLASSWSEGGAVCVMRPDGSGVRRLVNEGDGGYHPRFTADGAAVLFSSVSGIRIVPVAGGPASTLHERVSGMQLAANGTTIAFVNGEYAFDLHVYLMPITGGKTLQLTKERSGYGCGAFVPNGRALIYVRERDSFKYDLVEISSDDGHLHVIADGIIFENPLGWSAAAEIPLKIR